VLNGVKNNSDVKISPYYKIMENVTLISLFILLLFDTPTCQMTSWVAKREKMILALAYKVIVCLI